MKQIPASLLTLLAGIFIALVSLWTGQHHGLLPEQASEQAPLVDGLFDLMVTIATALFLIVQGAIVLFVIQFRQRKGDNTDGLPIEGSFPLEVLWTAIPAVIVIGLGVYSVAVYEQMGGFNLASAHDMAHHSPSVMIAQMPDQPVAPLVSDTEMADAANATDPTAAPYGFGATPDEVGHLPDLTVNVTGLQYAWIFNYPEAGVTTGELHVPIGADVQLNISAQDVIHSLWVPQFRLKQDAIPGQPTQLRFVATKEGSYPIVCTELCGGYHGSMRSQVIVHSPDGYQTWLSENQIAQAEMAPGAMEQRIAVDPTTQSESEFLAPYSHDLGVNADLLAQLHTHPS